MLTEIDDRRGVVKTYWADIKKRIQKVTPELAYQIDQVSPDKSFPVYLAYYPFGDMKGDTVSPFIPLPNGGHYRLSASDVPKDIKRDLWYGKDSTPLGMLLENTLEYFIDLKDLNITIPWQVIYPGAFFPLGRLLEGKNNRTYSPNGILSAVAGCRSVFMLPKIGCLNNHFSLQKEHNIQSPPPKSLYDHWDIFKEIIRNDESCHWRTCVVYFSETWVKHINNDPAWQKIREILLERAWNSYVYERNQIYYDFAYSLIKNKRNLKPNPYLADTAQHLFAIALGAVPGYTPLCDDSLMPVKTIQKAFVESYGLKKYIPTIMGPHHYRLEDESSYPVYYSLHAPSTLSFSPKSRKLSSTIFEMRELKHIVTVFNEELIKDKNILQDTIVSEVAKVTDFDFYHYRPDKHYYIKSSTEIELRDDRFSRKFTNYSSKDATFSCDAPFLRGCVRIGKKN